MQLTSAKINGQAQSSKKIVRRKLQSLLVAGSLAALAQRHEAHTAKTMARGGLAREENLRQEWDRIKNFPDTDRAVVKAKILLIADLVSLDLEKRFHILDSICHSAATGDWVATFYCKFLRKRIRELNQIRNLFGVQVSAIQSRLVASGERGRVVDHLQTAYSNFGKAVDQVIALANTTIIT